MRKAAIVALAVLLLAGCASVQHTEFFVEVSETRGVPGLEVRLEELGQAWWGLTVENHSDSLVRLVWDESAYVSTTGESSRIIRGETRRIDTAQSQPPSPIPPGATLQEIFIPEWGVQYLDSNAYIPVGDATKPARIYLTFDVAGQKYSWEGQVWFRELE